MGQPAVVEGDTVTGTCAGHQIPGPTGSPAPGPPMPFAARLTDQLASTVSIAGKRAATEGSSGVNAPAHPGLHASDSKAQPDTQAAQITGGSGSVTFDGKPAAYLGCPATACLAPAAVVAGSGTSVRIGA